MCCNALAFLSVSSLQKWLTQGRKDHAAREETAFGVFYALWRKNYAGRVLDREPERMAEMKRALTMMDADTIDGKRQRAARKGCLPDANTVLWPPQARTVHRRAD